MGEPSLQAACEARIGKVLKGKWTLERIVGVGGMAAVYVAQHKIGRREAIKILHPEIARSKELRARFELEAEAVNRFKHPGVVEIRDSDVSEDGCPFLVMELLEGENLAQRAGRLNGLPPDELLRDMDVLLDVLAAAHAQGIVHRDIKLDNLFLTRDQQLKVLDFGIARLASAQALTRVGARLGTTAYMAPEQASGGEGVDARTDIFAVGATMFRVVAKRRIHEAASDADLLIKMASDSAPPLASVVPGVDHGLALVIDRALAFRKEDRYPNALTMQGDVRALLGGELPPFALARQGAASVAPPPVSVPAPSAFGTDATRAEGAAFVAEATAAAAPPASVSPQSLPASRRVASHTVALATPTPGPVMAMGAPPSYGYPPPPASFAPSVVPSVAPSLPPLTPQGFATPAIPPKRSSGGTAVAIGLALVAVLGIAGTGLFFVMSDSPDNSASASADDDDDDTKKKKKKSDKQPETKAPSAPAAPPATPSPTAPAAEPEPEPEREEEEDKKAEEDSANDKEPSKPASPGKPAGTQHPASPGTSPFSPAPSGSAKAKVPIRVR